MKTLGPYRTAVFASLVALGMVGFSGCGLLHPAANTDDLAGPPPTGTFVLSYKAENGHGKQMEVPLTPGMSVQTALEQAKLTKKFKNMDIKVMRVTPLSQGEPVPLTVEYDTAHDCVGPLHDMALYPGDHLIVEENTASVLDRGLDGMIGALGLSRR